MPPIPKEIYKAIEYFCLKLNSTVSPIRAMLILIQVSDPSPAKNNPMIAIQTLNAQLKITIPNTANPQPKTIENFLP